MARIVIVERPGGPWGCGCVSVFALAGWITAVVRDAFLLNWLWLIVDIILPPVGAIRGILMWLGWA